MSDEVEKEREEKESPEQKVIREKKKKITIDIDPDIVRKYKFCQTAIKKCQERMQERMAPHQKKSVDINFDVQMFEFDFQEKHNNRITAMKPHEVTPEDLVKWNELQRKQVDASRVLRNIATTSPQALEIKKYKKLMEKYTEQVCNSIGADAGDINWAKGTAEVHKLRDAAEIEAEVLDDLKSIPDTKVVEEQSASIEDAPLNQEA